MINSASHEESVDPARFKLSPNIDLLFTESGSSFGDRVRAAADAGFDAVEMWTAGDKDVVGIGRALSDTGIRLLSLVAEPRAKLIDPETHDEFVAGIRKSCLIARDLGCPRIVVGSREGTPFAPRKKQHAVVVRALARAAQVAADLDIVVALENLNTAIDHPGILFDSAAECLSAIREVGSTHLRLFYDRYHALAMGESLAVLDGSVDLVCYVQIADLPGRGEPGTGHVDWQAELVALAKLGYAGYLGLEYYKTTPTLASMRYIREVVASSSIPSIGR